MQRTVEASSAKTEITAAADLSRYVAQLFVGAWPKPYLLALNVQSDNAKFYVLAERAA